MRAPQRFTAVAGVIYIDGHEVTDDEVNDAIHGLATQAGRGGPWAGGYHRASMDLWDTLKLAKRQREQRAA